VRSSAALDPDNLEPPRELWPLSKSKDLDEWLQARAKLRERKGRELHPLDS